MANSVNGDVHILYYNHSEVTHLRGFITFHICSTINKIHSNQAIGAQKLRGIWAIVALSPETRLVLLHAGCLTINQRVLVKDLPLWASDDLVK